MDIKIPLSLLKQHLETNATTENLVEALSLCGPTVDRVTQHMDETVLEIEAITNRVDSASVLGVAREAAAILPEFGHEAEVTKSPRFDSDLFDKDKLSLEIQIQDQSLIPRFCAVVLEDVAVGRSSVETANWLNCADIRDLNNVVDITNELTLRYGQPCHVFDYDKIVGHKLVVRESRKGEKITTLDDKEHVLPGKDIVIEDGGGRLIDLCGIMGGQLSCVDENTKRVILFVQTYEPKHIRRTSLALQARSLAAQIFEKGPDIEIVDDVLCEGVLMMIERCQAKVASKLIDIYPNPKDNKTIKLYPEEVASVAGVQLDFEHIARILKRLGFDVKSVDSAMEVTVPSYRYVDINIKEDLIEEILRVYGYFRLPSLLPATQLVDSKLSPLLSNELRTKKLLCDLGFNEVFNYSLTNINIYTKANIPLNEYITLTNPLTEDFAIMRTSLIPQMLQTVADNKGKTKTFNFFELSNTYIEYHEGNLPKEQSTLSVISNKNILDLKGVIEVVLSRLGVEVEFTNSQAEDCFEQMAILKIGDDVCGRLGVIKSSTLRAFEIDTDLVLTELNFDLISKFSSKAKVYTPIPSQTPLYLDVTLSSSSPVGVLLKAIKGFDKSIYSAEFLSVYNDKKTFRVHFFENGPVELKKAEQIVTKLTKELE